MHLRLDDEAAGAKVNVLLVLALRDGLDLVLRELAAQSTGLLGTKVQRLVLLALVELTQVGTLLEVDHGQDTGNVLANRVAVMLVHCDITRTCEPACWTHHRPPSGHGAEEAPCGAPRPGSAGPSWTCSGDRECGPWPAVLAYLSVLQRDSNIAEHEQMHISHTACCAPAAAPTYHDDDTREEGGW